jgi:hypothetical protein
MKLSRVNSTKELCAWFKQHGLTPSENAHVDFVDDVHTSGSWHYRRGPGVLQSNRQGTCAIDLNDYDVSDTKFYRLRRGDWKLWKPMSETEALNTVYNKLRRAAQKHRWPVAEMFFAGRGYKASAGWNYNVAISGHDGHLHVGFSSDRW